MNDSPGPKNDSPDPTSPARAWVFGDDIDTDQIIPSRFLVHSEPTKLGQHVFNDMRPEFSSSEPHDEFVIAGRNFGSGSSREHAPIALSGAGVAGIVAQSVARIFFRNAINLGLPVLICPETDAIEDGDEVSLDPSNGIVTNHTRNERYETDPIPPFLQELVEAGGLKPYTREKLDRNQ